VEGFQPEDESGLLIDAVERWRSDRAESLGIARTTLTVSGPFEALGMDAVYILRAERHPIEIEIHVFRGGVMDVMRVNWDELSHVQTGIRVTSAEELAATLDQLVGE